MGHLSNTEARIIAQRDAHRARTNARLKPHFAKMGVLFKNAATSENPYRYWDDPEWMRDMLSAVAGITDCEHVQEALVAFCADNDMDIDGRPLHDSNTLDNEYRQQVRRDYYHAQMGA